MTQAQESIRSALAVLLQKFPYQSISVQAIYSEAGLSRKTFSRHFGSKEEVVISQLRADTIGPVDSIMDLLPLDDIKDSTQIVLRRVYTAFYENRAYYKKVVDGLGVMWLVQQMLEIPRELGERPYQKNDLPVDEKSFVVAIVTGANAIALKWWVEEGFQTSPKKLATMVSKWVYTPLDEMKYDENEDSRPTGETFLPKKP